MLKLEKLDKPVVPAVSLWRGGGALVGGFYAVGDTPHPFPAPIPTCLGA
jgi:hypothetical protein